MRYLPRPLYTEMVEKGYLGAWSATGRSHQNVLAFDAYLEHLETLCSRGIDYRSGSHVKNRAMQWALDLLAVQVPVSQGARAWVHRLSHA